MLKRKKVSVARFCVAAFSLFGGRAEAGLQCYEIYGEWLFGDTSKCWVEDVNRKFGSIGGTLERCTSSNGVSKNMLEWVNAGDTNCHPPATLHRDVVVDVFVHVHA